MELGFSHEKNPAANANASACFSCRHSSRRFGLSPDTILAVSIFFLAAVSVISLGLQAAVRIIGLLIQSAASKNPPKALSSVS